ncbi:MAG: hypothetical protein KA020_14760 [Planctomycetes bacterium]|nr:hypothetical protein [Planctomycetota bacterium]
MPADRPAFAAFVNQLSAHRAETHSTDQIVWDRILADDPVGSFRPPMFNEADASLRAAFDAAVKESIAKEPKG